jgi:hypothetical protein
MVDPSPTPTEAITRAVKTSSEDECAGAEAIGVRATSPTSAPVEPVEPGSERVHALISREVGSLCPDGPLATEIEELLAEALRDDPVLEVLLRGDDGPE